MSNYDVSRLAFGSVQQHDGLYDINIQISRCTPNIAVEILRHVQISVSNLPLLVIESTPEEESGVS